MNGPLRVGVLVSGGGRSAVHLAETLRGAPDRPAEVVAVVATRPDIPAIGRCRDAGLPVTIVDGTAAGLDDRIDAALAAAGVELVVLAGYLRRFRVGERWRGKAINIHPALLPRHGGAGMYGLAVHRSVLAAGDPETGCTVHWVDEEYDRGPAILARRVPTRGGDTPETLAERVFAEERVARPEAVLRIAAARVGSATIAPCDASSAR